jgi:hypothetical protein
MSEQSTAAGTTGPKTAGGTGQSAEDDLYIRWPIWTAPADRQPRPERR